jgi:hypothetical protein
VGEGVQRVAELNEPDSGQRMDDQTGIDVQHQW